MTIAEGLEKIGVSVNVAEKQRSQDYGCYLGSLPKRWGTNCQFVMDTVFTLHLEIKKRKRRKNPACLETLPKHLLFVSSSLCFGR